MKKVYNNSDLVYSFADNSIKEGRNANGSLFISNNGKEIYSYGYHYLLARHLNEQSILINDTGYSATTGTHISLVTSASSHKKRFFVTETDINKVYNEIKYLLKKLGVARKPSIYLVKIQKLLNAYFEFQNYCINRKELKNYIDDKRLSNYKFLKSLASKLNI